MILKALCTLNIILRYPSIPSFVDISVPAWHETCHPAWSSVRTPCVSQATGGIWVAKKEQAEKLNTRKRWRAHTVWICLGVPPKKILYFEWSPPWYLFVIVLPYHLEIYGTIFWHSILACYRAFYLTFFSGILSGICSDILFWHSIWYIFGDSLRLRPSEEHSDPELAVENRGVTLIQRLLFGSSGEHCDLELAVEVRRRKEVEGGERRRKDEEGGREGRRKAGRLT